MIGETLDGTDVGVSFYVTCGTDAFWFVIWVDFSKL